MEDQVRRFVEMLAETDGIKNAELATRLDVSVRTVRNYLHRANEELVPSATIANEHGVLSLCVADEPSFRAIVDGRAGATGLPQTQDERVFYLLEDLLGRVSWVTLEDLAQNLFVTTRTLSDDLRLVERELARFSMELVRKPRYGIRVQGSEMGRRLCLATVLSGRGLYGDRAAGIDFQGRLDRLAACAEQALANSGLQVSSVAYQNLIVHLAVALMRIDAGCYVPWDASLDECMHGTQEYAAAHALASAIEQEFDIVLPEEEVLYISIHLSGRQTLPDAREDAGLVISDEVWGVVENMLERVWEAFHIDLRGDLELRMNLARHIVPLSVRLTWHLRMENPLLQDIKTRFPLAYALAVNSSSVLEETFGAAPSEDEMGYIALTYALALERRQGAPAKKSILVVCASGQGSARLLEHRYRQQFGDYLEHIAVCDAARIGEQDFSSIDYVFTTVPLEVEVPVPVMMVRFFPDAQEAERVRDVLRGGALSSLVEPCFDRARFFSHLACTDKQEALDELISRAIKTGLVDELFSKLVYRRENASATSFGNGVAMPHPLEPAGDETFVTVGILDRPIRWDEYGHEVRVVFLVAFSRSGGEQSRALMDALAEIFMDREGLNLLMREQSWEALQALISAHAA